MSPSVALQQFEWMKPNIPLNFRKALTSLPSWTDPPYLTDKRTYQQSNLCEIYWNLCRKRQVKYSIKVWFCSVSKSWINCKLGRLAGEAIPVPAVIAPLLKNIKSRWTTHAGCATAMFQLSATPCPTTTPLLYLADLFSNQFSRWDSSLLFSIELLISDNEETIAGQVPRREGQNAPREENACAHSLPKVQLLIIVRISN